MKEATVTKAEGGISAERLPGLGLILNLISFLSQEADSTYTSP